MAEATPPAWAEILERLPIGVFTIDRAWRIGSWNGRMSNWTGIEAKRAVGRPLGEVLPRLAEAHNQTRLEPVMAGGPPVVFSWQLHHDLYPKGPEARGELDAYYTNKAPGGVPG